MNSSSVVFALFMLLLPVATRAQTVQSAVSRVVTINPFMLFIGYPAAEYEQRVTSILAVGAGASSMNYNDGNTRRTNLDAKVRYYPNEKSLEGFGIAGSLGITYMTTAPWVYCYTACPAASRRSFTAPGSTVELSYQWLLGSRKATAVAMGGGIRRIFASEAGWGREDRILPTARLNFGYAF